MTVRCPSCGTRYRLPPRSRLGRHPTYRCSRCEHVFAPDEEAEAPALDDVEDEPLAPEDEDDEPVFTIEAAAAEVEEEPDPPPARARAAETTREAPSPARFAIRAAVFVTLVYGLVSIYLHTHPDRAGVLLGEIPLVGAEMQETRLNPGSIQLADLRGEFERVHGDRLVFVVTGVAINNAPTSVAGIQIEAQIMGPDGPPERQIVYCGTAPQDVSDLGIREIELLQTLKPSSDWTLGPGAQDRFLVAFIDPPASITEFGAEVVAVRGARTPGR